METIFRKSKVREIEEKNQPGGNEKWKIKGQQSQKCAKEALKYLHHFLSDISTFIEQIGKSIVSRSTQRNI